MGRPKGHTKAGGRKKGTPNKDTQPIREAIQLIIEDNMTRLRDAYSKLNDKELIDKLTPLLEYRIPKLNRTDLTNDGDKFNFNGTNSIESIKRIMGLLDTARTRGNIQPVSSN